MITHMLLSWFQVVVHFSYNYFLFIELYSAHVICAVAMFFVLPILYFTALSYIYILIKNVDKIDNTPNITTCVFRNQKINSNGYDCMLAMTKFNNFISKYMHIYMIMIMGEP